MARSLHVLASLDACPAHPCDNGCGCSAAWGVDVGTTFWRVCKRCLLPLLSQYLLIPLTEAAPPSLTVGHHPGRKS